MEKDSEPHRLWSSSLDDDTDPDSISRPCQCTFCKRGFTNAQALGGHMNIHRKDRVDQIRKTTAPMSNSPLTGACTLSGFNARIDQNSHHRESNAPAKTWAYADHDLNAQSSSTALLLLVDRSPLDHRRQEVRYDEDCARYCELKLAQSDHPVVNIAEDGDKELDLELRLGPVDRTIQ